MNSGLKVHLCVVSVYALILAGFGALGAYWLSRVVESIVGGL